MVIFYLSDPTFDKVWYVTFSILTAVLSNAKKLILLWIISVLGNINLLQCHLFFPSLFIRIKIIFDLSTRILIVLFVKIEIHLDIDFQEVLRNIQCNIVKIVNFVTHRYKWVFFEMKVSRAKLGSIQPGDLESAININLLDFFLNFQFHNSRLNKIQAMNFSFCEKSVI